MINAVGMRWLHALRNAWSKYSTGHLIQFCFRMNVFSKTDSRKFQEACKNLTVCHTLCLQYYRFQ